MHNLFLGELHHHVRQVWNLDSVGQSSSSGVEKQSVTHSPKTQQTQLNRVFSALSTRNEAALIDVRKDYLSAVARFNHAIGLTSTDPSKRELARALLRWRQHDLSTFRLPPVFPESVKRFHLSVDEAPREPSRYAIFTRDVLDVVRQDIQATVLPSWIEKVPSNFGSPGHGKLKADHWRTVCTINLVITLVRLWGTVRSSAEEVEVLKNFLHLVIAVTSASRRSMDQARAAMYEYHMEQYLRGLRQLYNHALVPNHHLSLHLRHFLEQFGPVHGWWAFAFERYNGLLQRMKTNFKPVEMPQTFMRYFYMGSALRWLMRVTPWPKGAEYEQMVKSFETAFNDRVRGTRVTDFLSFGEPSLHSDFDYDHRREALLASEDYQALLSLVNASSAIKFQAYDSTGAFDGRPYLHPRGQFVHNVHHDGVRFATAQSGERDCNIVYCRAGMLKAGQISSIFYHQRTGPHGLIVEPFLIVRPYTELSPAHAAHDPYRRFPEINTQLYYNTFEPSKDVVSLGPGIGHLATLTYTPPDVGQECVVALSLDRVSRG
ncbi:hypothetical protein LXA43DRAFT_904217 [Ganoderma leucocontextum]|nr:hypothetical protein LXA43DRAFT_904217 [Ganoderma leucocontextum]